MKSAETCEVSVFNPMSGLFEQVKSTHSFAWYGKIPCTGVYRCVYCGYAPPEKQRNVHFIGGNRTNGE